MISSGCEQQKNQNLWHDRFEFSLFLQTGPALPYALDDSAMAESPDGKGVLLFGGSNVGRTPRDLILELRSGADSWNILNIILETGRHGHVVIPIKWEWTYEQYK